MQYVYLVRDAVKEEVVCSCMAPNDATVIRENLGALSRILPLKDIQIYRAGIVSTDFDPDDTSVLPVSGIPLTLVDVNSYSFPNPDEKVSLKNNRGESSAVDNTVISANN